MRFLIMRSLGGRNTDHSDQDCVCVCVYTGVQAGAGGPVLVTVYTGVQAGAGGPVLVRVYTAA